MIAKVTRTMEQHKADSKDYYGILGLRPDAKPRVIKGAYKRLTRLYDHSPSTGQESATAFSERAARVKEAYEVLSDPVRRAAYDRTLEERRDSGETGAGGQTSEEIVDLMALVAQDVSRSRRGKALRVPELSKGARRQIRMGAVSVLAVLIAGSALAFAQPGHVLAAPFKDVAASIAEVSSVAAVRLIEEVRGVVALFERNVVSTAVQAMRITEDLRVLPAVTVPTNDMSRFPSAEHCLFPHYLDKRFSQFRYTLDGDGIVAVDKSTATTDAFLKRIGERLSQLRTEESSAGKQPTIPVLP